MKTPRVFGIGFHKAGTSSLGVALEILGYRVCSVIEERNRKDLPARLQEIAWDYIDNGGFDAFQDNPWPILYREIDERYPGSKFVLTSRPTHKWLASQVRHFGKSKTVMREIIYGVGCPEGNEEIYAERFDRHNAEVRAYFADRPQDMVEIELGDPDSWERLCGLLGVPVPDLPWPHANPAAERERKGSGLFGVWNRMSLRLMRLKRRIFQRRSRFPRKPPVS